MAKSYTANIELAKSGDKVFHALTEVQKWWSRDYEGKSSELNDEFVICHPERHYSKQKLVEVIPGSKIVWLVTDSNLNWLKNDKAEWTDTKMIFELKAEGNTTGLKFTHEGLVPEKECYAMCEQGWNTVIKERLFNFVMYGMEI